MKTFYDWFMQYDTTEQLALLACAIIYGLLHAYIIDQGIKKGRSHGPFRDHK